MITIVTVSLNDLAGIKETFRSLRQQTFRNVQHVIIDGASTDGTAAWARENVVFDDTVVLSEPDEGIYQAMNKGLGLARGELVCFLNSGDRFADRDVLGVVVNSYEHESWPWAYGFGRMVTASGRTSAGGRVRKRHSWLRQTFWSYEICHQTVFMPPALARKLGGFDEEFRIAADYKLVTNAGRIAEPHVFPRVMAVTMEGGVSSMRTVESLHETHRARSEILALTGWRKGADRCLTTVLIARSRSRRFVGRLLRRWGVDLGGPSKFVARAARR